MHPDIFTERWAAAWCRALNESPAYRRAAAGWQGAVVLVMLADAALGVAERRRVLLDLHAGSCRGARVASDDDEQAAAYVLEAPAGAWRELLSGRLAPLTALLGGKLRLSRGDLAGLLPYAGAARELVSTAALVQSQFPEPA
jgi:putative sterol carrier protein